MPKLPTFTANIGDAPVSGGRRAAAQDNALGLVGRSLSRGADALLAAKEDKESRTALIASSEIRTKYARALDEASLSGEDTEKLKEKMSEELAKISEGFETTRGEQNLALYSANAELMFDEQANRIRITRAAAEARLEGQKFLNSESEMLRSNPGYLKAAEQNATAFALTLRNIPPEQRAEIEAGLRKELNMAAAVSSARIDPEAAKKRLEAGEWDLTPSQRETAVGKADTEIRARRAEEAYERALADRDVRDRDDKARDKHFADIIGGSATRRQIMDDADLTPQTREHLIVFMEARAKEAATTEKKSNPVVMRNLWLRIHAPDGDPKKIYNGEAIFEAVKAGHLNTTDANQLNTLVGMQKDENNRSFGVRLGGRMSTVAGVMRSAPEFAAQPELSAAIQLEMTAQVEQASARLRAENKDPAVLLDPDSKDYYFTPGRIKQVAEDVKARARAIANQGLPQVNSQAEYDALPVGTVFVDSAGNQGVKQTAKPRQAVTGTIIRDVEGGQ